MIGYLTGSIKFKELNYLIVDVNKVGYQIFVPFFIWQNCQINQTYEFYIYTCVREDEITLYGFAKKEEKQIFTHLISVSGIGPKLAMNIISSAGSAAKIINAIQTADVDFFQNIKGVGKKSSQRIIVDLKSKIGSLQELDLQAEIDSDLFEALKGLGFSGEEIKKSTKGIDKSLSLEEKIKSALKDR